MKGNIIIALTLIANILIWGWYAEAIREDERNKISSEERNNRYPWEKK
jgi:hypothetical protein